MNCIAMAGSFATSFAVAETDRCSFHCDYSSSVHCFRDQVRFLGRKRSGIKPLVCTYCIHRARYRW